MKTLQINGNSFDVFEDRASADVFFSADVQHGAAWSALSNDVKDRALVSVTRFLNAIRWSARLNRDTPQDDFLTGFYVLSAKLAAAPNLLERFQASKANGPITDVKAGSVNVKFDRPLEQNMRDNADSPVPLDVAPYFAPYFAKPPVPCGFVAGDFGTPSDDNFDRS